MPRVPRATSHVDSVPRTQPQQQVRLAIPPDPGLPNLAVGRGPARRDHEEAVAAEAQANQPLVGLLRHVTVHHHGVARRVDVDDGRLGERLREQGLQEPGDVRGEVGMVSVTGRICAFRPIVLAAESHPPELAVHDLPDREGLVDGGILGLELGGRIGMEGEERQGISGLVFGVWNVIVGVEVCLVPGLTEVPVDETADEGLLDLRGDEGGNDEKT